MAAGVQAARVAVLCDFGMTFPLHEAGHMAPKTLIYESFGGHATQKWMNQPPEHGCA